MAKVLWPQAGVVLRTRERWQLLKAPDAGQTEVQWQISTSATITTASVGFDDRVWDSLLRAADDEVIGDDWIEPVAFEPAPNTTYHVHARVRIASVVQAWAASVSVTTTSELTLSTWAEAQS